MNKEYITAQIATVKELLVESEKAGDPLGEYSFASRLDELKYELRHCNE